MYTTQLQHLESNRASLAWIDAPVDTATPGIQRVTLTNPSPTATVLFKFKTTAPMHFRVRPASGVLAPLASVTAGVQWSGAAPMRAHESVLVQTMVVAEGEVVAAHQVSQQFRAAPRDAIANLILPCKSSALPARVAALRAPISALRAPTPPMVALPNKDPVPVPSSWLAPLLASTYQQWLTRLLVMTTLVALFGPWSRALQAAVWALVNDSASAVAARVPVRKWVRDRFGGAMVGGAAWQVGNGGAMVAVH
ncbi:hypothetical protein AMAG_05943 [Allomyces macrogynus ATCC 38327]|uniref:MSP domain-containing protein n=1 Tax=Allomyces macrogynus (strain ATCC 38327) TaxID=578462 RepID=A0A0L0SDV1_ALLM3|nr:hypothetical protein AMAG_05943 [Allomyces macrogynus ATCC 38327]|eukprot:KNE60565.1 hypothetical protein AMAG_05943 [Allomyces macrogynus ATCC 38327]